MIFEMVNNFFNVFLFKPENLREFFSFSDSQILRFLSFLHNLLDRTFSFRINLDEIDSVREVVHVDSYVI